MNTIVSIAVVVVAAAVALYALKKESLITTLATIFACVIAGVIAFAFFEQLTARVSEPESALLAWRPALFFILLFAVPFIIFKTIINASINESVEFSTGVERIGRIVFGAVLGFLVSGFILTALAIAPLKMSLPYARFDEKHLTPYSPETLSIGSDIFVTNFFKMVSGNSFSGEKRFGSLHPNFIDQSYINRLKIQKVTAYTGKNTLKTPDENGYRILDKLSYIDGNSVKISDGYNLAAVTIGIAKRDRRHTLPLSFSQIRLICKYSDSAEDNFQAETYSCYPIAELKTNGKAKPVSLKDRFEFPAKSEGDIFWIDFVFEIEADSEPIFVQLKQNEIARVQINAENIQISED